jgi:3-deoxy-D-manno-octulosonic-acid transferase
MWHILYNILLILASPVILVVLLSKKRCRRGLCQRMGWRPSCAERFSRPVIWIHAVSLGEVVAVAPLVRRLHERSPEFALVVSTVTETGREAVERLLAGVAHHCYAPLDFSWAVTKAIEALRPRLFLFVETELWPNLLRQLAVRGVPSVMVNGRLSSKSYRGYSRIRFFWQPLLQGIRYCLMQSQRDVERIVSLGADPERVIRTGNLKFDQAGGPMSPALTRLDRASFGLMDDEKVIVAGSTHAGEEAILLAVWERLKAECPGLVLLIAPRHTERADELHGVIASKGYQIIRRTHLRAGGQSRGEPGRGSRVILLDTRGELSEAYRFGTVAFVGGTLVPVGGHNLLEPACWGKPVLFGPYTDHCAEVASLLIDGAGGIRVSGEEQLFESLRRCLKDEAYAIQVGTAAQCVMQANQGALSKSLAVIQSLLDEDSTNRGGIARLKAAPLSHACDA